MARIAPPQRPGLFARVVYFLTKRKLGRVVLPVQISAHHPKILRGMVQMEQAQAGAHSVPHALKELASIKTAMLIGCPF